MPIFAHSSTGYDEQIHLPPALTTPTRNCRVYAAEPDLTGRGTPADERRSSGGPSTSRMSWPTRSTPDQAARSGRLPSSTRRAAAAKAVHRRHHGRSTLTFEPFTEKQIELVTTFADQAVIAIENVRLFEEVQARTRELTESLEQQTATSEVLKVISSSLTDTQPVFDAIVKSGSKLFPDAAISIALPDGDQVKAVAFAESDPARAEAWRRRFPNPLTREYMHGAAILDCKIVDIPDVAEAPPEFAIGARNFMASGYRAVTIIPMIRNEAAIGVLSVIRVAAGPLSEKERATLRTFANQAVIAIENTRLLERAAGSHATSLPARSRELQALGEVSHAVNSTLDLETVLSTIVAKAVQLSATDAGAIYVFSNLRQKFRLRATYGMSDGAD